MSSRAYRYFAEACWQPIQRARRLAAWSPSAAERLRTVLVTVLAGRPGKPLRRPVRVSIQLGAEPISMWIGDASELLVMEEILCDHSYDFELYPPPSCIVDLGANIGLSAAYFRWRWPAAAIHAVEPDPVTFARLEANVGHWPRVQLHRCAISGEDGRGLLVQNGASWTSRLQDANGSSDVLAVPTARLETLLDAVSVERVDLLKVDIEGAERALLADPGSLARVDAIIGELHRSEFGVDPLGELEELLADFVVQVRSHSPTTLTWSARRRRADAT